MWKNALLKFRNPLSLFMELVIPCAVLFALVAIRLQINPRVEPLNYPTDFQYAPTLQDLFTDIPCNSENLLWRCNTFDNCDFVTDDDYSNCQRRYIAVAPYNSDVSDAYAASLEFVEWGNTLANVSTIFVHFESENAFTDYYKGPDYSREAAVDIFSALVVFNAGGPVWDYTLRFNKTFIYNDDTYSLPQTRIDAVQDSLKTPDQDPEDDSSFGSPAYLETYNDFNYFTLASNVNSYINTVTCRDAGLCNSTESVDVTVIGTAKFPNVKELISGFWGQIGDFFSLLMIIALLYPLSNNIKSLVVEKETRVREGFMIMSLRSEVLWVAWMIHFLGVIIPLSIALTLIGTMLFIYSDTKYVFLYFFMFLLASTSYTILISVMFSKSKSASIVGCLLFFGGYFIYIGLSSDTLLSRAQLMLACLHPATAFTFGTLAFKEYEDSKIGVTEYTYDETSTYKITFADTITMQAVNFFWLLFVAWYLGEVWPSEYGTSKPVYFLFQPSYWKSMWKSVSRQMKSKPSDNHMQRVADNGKHVGDGGHIELSGVGDGSGAPSGRDYVLQESQANVEAVPEALRGQKDSHRCIEINNLVKSFETATGIKMAVDGLDFTIYSEQITALLGHNGAGKTTLISMLTGLIPITSGSASIYGEDVAEAIGEIRKNMGYCPQHDVLIPEMTVAEHLHLFASIKGCDNATIDHEVEKMIESVGLVDKANSFAANLSGGQKRKLSLGIAFIGKSRIIFLDEPTSGMDPYSRRLTWNVIRKHREGRIIVLTTHFMDEADLLGDRIAIMANGKLRCCGSNLYLKQKYGVGYNMTMEKADSSHFDSKLVISLVQEFVPDCTVLTDVGAEIAIQLPFKSSGSFEKMFKALDAQLERIGIRSYGISATTLEEVFIRVAAGVASEKQELLAAPAAEAEPAKEPVTALAVPEAGGTDGVMLGGDGSGEKDEEAQKPCMADIDSVLEKYGEDEKFALFFLHLYALIGKRYYYFRRDSKSWVFQFMVPVVFVLLGMIVMRFSPIFSDQPSIKISASMFNDGIDTDHLPYPYSASDMICPFESNCSLGKFPVSGQDELMQYVAGAGLLPVQPLDSAVTIYNMSYFLLENREDFKASRFGATTFFELETSAADKKVSYVVHANFTGVHAGPLFAHLVADAATRVYNAATSITLRLHPLEETDREETQYSSFNATNVILFMLLALPFIPASMAMFVVREKEIKSKHLQLVSGVSVAAYWIGTYIWDVATYMLSAWLMIFVICVFPGN
jgi:ATP-binding cassette subfamily A (ABC1) protein 3